MSSVQSGCVHLLLNMLQGLPASVTATPGLLEMLPLPVTSSLPLPRPSQLPSRALIPLPWSQGLCTSHSRRPEPCVRELFGILLLMGALAAGPSPLGPLRDRGPSLPARCSHAPALLLSEISLCVHRPFLLPENPCWTRNSVRAGMGPAHFLTLESVFAERTGERTTRTRGCSLLGQPRSFPQVSRRLWGLLGLWAFPGCQSRGLVSRMLLGGAGAGAPLGSGCSGKAPSVPFLRPPPWILFPHKSGHRGRVHRVLRGRLPGTQHLMGRTF